LNEKEEFVEEEVFDEKEEFVVEEEFNEKDEFIEEEEFNEKEGDSKIDSNIYCSGNHNISNNGFYTQTDSFACDICEENQKNESYMVGCRTCS